MNDLDINEADGLNHIIQRYYESLEYRDDGSNDLKLFESVKDWLDCGLFFTFRWGSGYRNSDQCAVYSNFSEAIPANIDAQILLFDHLQCDNENQLTNWWIRWYYD
eukprot:731006_1